MTKAPKKWKMAVLIWSAIYPLITILFLIFGKNFETIDPLPVRTLIITLIVVPLMVFVVMPPFQKLLNNWLNK